MIKVKKTRLFAAILVAFAVLSLFTACSKSDAPEGYQLAVCKGDNFRFYVPTQWTPNTTGGVSSAYYSADDNISVSVQKTDDGGELTLEEYWAKTETALKESLKDYTFVGDEKAILGGQAAHKYVYTATFTRGGKAEKYKFMQVIAKYKGEIYILGYNAPEDKYDLHLATVEGSSDGVGMIPYFKFAEPYKSDDKKISGKVTPPEGMKLISTDEVPYRFYVPEAWKINNRTEFAAAYVSDEDSSNVSAHMYMMDNDSPTTIEEYFAACEKSYKEIYASYTLISTTDIKMDGVSAKQYVYTLKSGGVEYKQLQAIVKKGEVYYTVTYTATADKFESHLTEVQKMIESFDIR